MRTAPNYCAEKGRQSPMIQRDFHLASWWFAGLTTVMTSIIFCFVCVMVYMVFVQRVSPLRKQTLKSVEAATENGRGLLIISHEFCLEWEDEATALRVFRRIPDRPGDPEEVFELALVPLRLLQGCHVRPRTVELPAGIRPGRYIYQNGLRFCSPVRCSTNWLPPVNIDIDTFEGRHQLQLSENQPQLPQ